MSLLLSTQSLFVVLFFLITLVFSGQFSMIPFEVRELIIEFADPNDLYSLGMTCATMKELVYDVLKVIIDASNHPDSIIQFVRNSDEMSEMLFKLINQPAQRGALLSLHNGILVNRPPSDYSNTPSLYNGFLKIKMQREIKDGLNIEEITHSNKLILRRLDQVEQILDLNKGSIPVQFRKAQVVNDNFLLAEHHNDNEMLHLYEFAEDGTVQKTPKSFKLPYPIGPIYSETKHMQWWSAQMDANGRYLTVKIRTQRQYGTEEWMKYDMETGKGEMFMEMEDEVQGSNFSKDLSLCVKCMDDNTIEIVDTRERKVIRQLPLLNINFSKIQVHGNRYLAFEMENQYYEWMIWDISSNVIWRTDFSMCEIHWLSDDLFTAHSDEDDWYIIQSMKQLGNPIVSCEYGNYGFDITSDEKLVKTHRMFDQNSEMYNHEIVTHGNRVFQVEFEENIKSIEMDSIH